MKKLYRFPLEGNKIFLKTSISFEEATGKEKEYFLAIEKEFKDLSRKENEACSYFSRVWRNTNKILVVLGIPEEEWGSFEYRQNGCKYEIYSRSSSYRSGGYEDFSCESSDGRLAVSGQEYKKGRTETKCHVIVEDMALFSIENKISIENPNAKSWDRDKSLSEEEALENYEKLTKASQELLNFWEQHPEIKEKGCKEIEVDLEKVNLD